MSRNHLTATIILAALLTSTALPALAQTTALSETTEVQLQDLPEALRNLDLQELKEEPGRKGMRKITGKTPGGATVKAMVDPEGALKGVSGGNVALPGAIVAELLPQALRQDQVFQQFASVLSVGTHADMIALRGKDANGEKVFALFAADGRLMRFGRGEPMRHIGKDKKEHGKHKGDGRHKQRRDKPSHGKDHGKPAEALPFDAAEVNRKLTDAGYSAFGFLHKDGPKIMLDAVNPQNEPVTLELDPAGEVVREQTR